MSATSASGKVCTAPGPVAQSCCSTVSGEWSSATNSCTVPIVDNDAFKNCVTNASSGAETISCQLNSKASTTTTATQPSSDAPPLRITRGAGVAVVASLLLTVICAV